MSKIWDKKKRDEKGDVTDYPKSMDFLRREAFGIGFELSVGKSGESSRDASVLWQLYQEGQLDKDALKSRFKGKYPILTLPQNLGRIARLGRDIRRREERIKNSDDRKYMTESRDLIRKWKEELNNRKWLINKVHKKIDISNKGAIRYQNRGGQKSPYVKFRIYWWGKKREEYLGEESQFKRAFNRQAKFRNFKEYLLDKGRTKFLKNLGNSAERSRMSLIQKKLKEYKTN